MHFKEIIEKVNDGKILAGLAGLVAYYLFLDNLPTKGSEPAKETAKA